MNANVAPLRKHDNGRSPAAVEAEAALLGAALCNSDILDLAARSLAPSDFYEPAHGRIFDAAVRARKTGIAVSPVTLKHQLDGEASLTPLGGLAYLAGLTGNGLGHLDPQGLIVQIADYAARRQVMEWHLAGLEACCDVTVPLEPLTPPEVAGTGAPLPLLDLNALARLKPQPKAFTIPKIAPAGEVTLFTGAGAVGKSLLAQQLCTAMAMGRPTLGLQLTASPAIYLTCEDDPDQLHWRQAHICKLLGVEMAHLAGALFLGSLRGQQDNALAHFAPDGRISPAPMFSRLSATLKSTGAKLLCLDNVAHLFTGNENDRGHVTQFVNLLNRMAGDAGAAILLLAHPNKAGDSYSGSTAWLNAVRSQVFMSRPEEEASDPDARTLTIGKPNYTRAGEAIHFRWHEWAFALDDDIPAGQRDQLEQTIRASSENAAFLRCLKAATAQHRNVSHTPGANYAPNVFARMPEGKGYTSKAFEAAFERLLHLGEIEINAQLWQGNNRHWKRGIRAVEKCAIPPAPTPCANPRHPTAQSGGNPCAEPRAPTPLYTTYIPGGASEGPLPSVVSNGRDADV